ncbi:MAG: sensor domain-containing diguanylate cyclase [Nevskia sp.]
MQAPALPLNESSRLSTLRALKILDTSPEERFDRLTRLARRLFGVPIALISLVDEDRQWFKSVQGIDAAETPRAISFCGHAILGDEMFLVPDAQLDHRFSDNPLVTGNPKIRFYAGFPLSVPNGSKLGTLCLIDREPRALNEDDCDLLEDLAKMAEQEIAAVQAATMDDLTMLSNRRGFTALAQHALNVCKRHSWNAALFFFDLTLFKQINDRYGHAEGDRALCSFAAILRSVFRDSDVVGRLGGDEFVVLLTNVGAHGVRDAQLRLTIALLQHNAESQRGYELGYSVGTAAYDPVHHQPIDALIDDADGSMYENKKQQARDRATRMAAAGAT